MFEFFDTILRLIGVFIHYIITTVQSFVQLLNHAVDGMQFLVTSIAYLPPFCRGAFVCIIGISVLMLILKVGG